MHDYIFKVLITAVMELRTIGLGYCGQDYPRVAKETSLDFTPLCIRLSGKGKL